MKGLNVLNLQKYNICFLSVIASLLSQAAALGFLCTTSPTTSLVTQSHTTFQFHNREELPLRVKAFQLQSITHTAAELQGIDLISKVQLQTSHYKSLLPMDQFKKVCFQKSSFKSLVSKVQFQKSSFKSLVPKVLFQKSNYIQMSSYKSLLPKDQFKKSHF